MMPTLISVLIILLSTALAATPPVLFAGATPMGFLLAIAALGLLGQRLPPVLVAVLSLVADALAGAPLGLHGVVALLMLLVMKRATAAFALQPWAVQSLAVALLLAVAQLAMMALLWMLGQGMGWWSAFMSWTVTLPLVPLLLWGMKKIEELRS